MVKPPTAKTVMKMGMSSFSFPANILPSLAQKAVIIPVCIISSKAPPMMKIKKMTDYFAASPSGKMILFTKKKMTIEMPPLSTVVPML